jgi:hypothetical protein
MTIDKVQLGRMIRSIDAINAASILARKDTWSNSYKQHANDIFKPKGKKSQDIDVVTYKLVKVYLKLIRDDCLFNMWGNITVLKGMLRALLRARLKAEDKK